MPSAEYLASFDIAQAPLVLLDGSGTIVRANLRAGALVGIAPAWLAGRHWSSLVAVPIDRPRIDRAIGETVVGDREQLGFGTFSYPRPDGEHASFAATARRLSADEGTELLLVRFIDLAEYERTKRELAGLRELDDLPVPDPEPAPCAAVEVDADGNITTWSPESSAMLGWEAAEMLGRPLSALLPAGGTELIEYALGGMELPRFSTVARRADGHYLAVDCTIEAVADAHGVQVGLHCQLDAQDDATPDAQQHWVATQQRLLRALRVALAHGIEREQLEQQIISAVASLTASPYVVISELREGGRALRLRGVSGWEPCTLPIAGPLEPTTLMARVVQDGTMQTVENWSQSELEHMELLRDAGIEAGIAVPVVSDGQVVGGIAAYRRRRGPWQSDAVEFLAEVARIYGDAISAWDRSVERRRQQLHDKLTGLPGLTLVLDRLEHSLELDRAAGLHTSVLVIDVDRFRRVNEAAGHKAGNRVLQEIPRRLQTLVGAADTIGRISGDEFVVVCRGLHDDTAAMLAADTVAEAFSQPFEVDGQEHVVGVSVGVATAHEQSTAQELLGDAEAALFRAKERGRGRVEAFDAKLRERVAHIAQTERALLGALEHGELVVHFQPIVELRSGRPVAVEALVRWQHPERGLVPPGEFIPVAEESGLIVPLGEQVLRAACQQGAQWRRAGVIDEHFQITVNLSVRQMAEPGLAALVLRVLDETGCAPANLAIEVTESVLADEHDAADVLTEIRSHGVRIMLDDFGTGYSSLSYLRQFEVDAIKIDRAFVAEIVERRQDAQLVSALVQMAGALGIDAIAEGVERPEQLQLLSELGCQLAQGFYFARPQPADEVTTVLERTDTKGSTT